MTTYAMICSNSGYFWGAVDATDPIEACKLLDQRVDPHAAGCRTYEQVGRRCDGYYVHHIDDVENADGINALDGQDPAVIDMVSAYPLVARVQVTEV